MSFAEIGGSVGLSPSATRERIQKLEDRGIIIKYGITVNNRLLGYDLEAFILVKVFSGKLKPFLDAIGSFPEVRKAYRKLEGKTCTWKLLQKIDFNYKT